MCEGKHTATEEKTSRHFACRCVYVWARARYVSAKSFFLISPSVAQIIPTFVAVHLGCMEVVTTEFFMHLPHKINTVLLPCNNEERETRVSGFHLFSGINGKGQTNGNLYISSYEFPIFLKNVKCSKMVVFSDFKYMFNYIYTLIDYSLGIYCPYSFHSCLTEQQDVNLSTLSS